MLGLSQHAGHLLISCPCQQDLPSASLHPDTYATSTLASCLRARNTGHVCECLTACDFGEHISSHLLRLSFLQVRYGDFNIFQLSGQRCLWRLWSASYCMKMRHPTPWGPEGMDQTWVPPKLGSIRCESSKTKNYIPRMMNICGCMWLLFLPVWDPDWAWQVVGISAVQPLVV